MTITTGEDVYYDPYDLDIYANPYPTFRRLREESPLYYNEKFDFYALSRFSDVEKALVDNATFSSARGVILEMIKSNLPSPPGMFIQEDPPFHTMHRGLLSRVFTPKKMNALEPQVRAYCGEVLDQLVGKGGFDFVDDYGALVPMTVIGMLLGIPQEDRQAIRVRGDERNRRVPGQPMDYENRAYDAADPTFFNDYIEWRADHPSDDLMTDLLQAEFEDETGTVRPLTRTEILAYVNLLASAGNDTTKRLISWAGKVLADHPDQRRELVENRSLIPNAIEEILRYEPSTSQIGRYVTRDIDYYGQTVPEGSTMLLLTASANHDDQVFAPDGDVFDIHRKIAHHLNFGYGAHYCLGAALARMEGRVALDELLNRFPEWEVDADNAVLDSSTIRGWRTLPVSTR